MARKPKAEGLAAIVAKQDPVSIQDLTMQDFFAAFALQGILSNKGVFSDDSDQAPVNFDGWMFEDCAKCAYEMADEMLTRRAT
jgi:hypothetical protein